MTASGNSLHIRKATHDDAAAIAAIYNYYIETSVSTFEETVLTEAEMAERIHSVSEKYVWLVGVVNNEIVGYAYANQWKTRSAYRLTVETSIYLRHGAEGNGFGRILYAELIKQTKALGYKCLIGGISLPNEASIKLHEALGYVKIGQFVRVGIKFGKWIDVGYWQLTFNN